MAVSLQRSGLTGRKIMYPDDIYNRAPRARAMLTPAQAPYAAALAPSVSPDIGTPISDYQGSDTDKGRQMREYDLDPVSWSDVKGPLTLAGVNLAAGLATGGASLPATLAATAAKTGMQMGLARLVKGGYRAAEKALGFGPDPGTQAVSDALKSYSKYGPGYNELGEFVGGKNYPRTISADERGGYDKAPETIGSGPGKGLPGTIGPGTGEQSMPDQSGIAGPGGIGKNAAQAGAGGTVGLGSAEVDRGWFDGDTGGNESESKSTGRGGVGDDPSAPEGGIW